MKVMTARHVGTRMKLPSARYCNVVDTEQHRNIWLVRNKRNFAFNDKHATLLYILTCRADLGDRCFWPINIDTSVNVG